MAHAAPGRRGGSSDEAGHRFSTMCFEPSGGLLLGIGLNLVVQGVNAGWLLLMPAAPLSGLIGWILARKLARQLPTSENG